MPAAPLFFLYEDRTLTFNDREKKENTPAVSKSVFLMKNIMFTCFLFGYAFFDFVQVYSETTVGFVTVLDRLTSVENGCVVFVATL